MKNLNAVIDHQEGLFTKISLEGHLTGLEAIRLRKSFVELLASKKGNIVLDLNKLSEIDLAGINVIAMLSKFILNDRHEFKIQIMEGSPILKTIKSTKLHRILPFDFLKIKRA